MGFSRTLLRCFAKSAQATDSERVGGDFEREKCEKSAQATENKDIKFPCGNPEISEDEDTAKGDLNARF